VTGTVTVTGAPQGFVPTFSGVGACPPAQPPGQVCANPIVALASGGKYTLSLDAGQWLLDGFYELNGFGGAFLGIPASVTVPAGGTVTQNFTIPYQAPAAIKGTIRVTGAPTGVTIQSFSVLLCPSFAPFTGGTPSIACVNGFSPQLTPGGTSGPYSLTGLPPGTWTAFPGYCTQFGCETNAKAGKTVTLVAGRTSTKRLTTPFIIPGSGLLTATVAVTGAPAGFADPVGVSACQVGTGNCQTFFAFGQPGNTVQLLLADGAWKVNGFYLVAPFDNTIAGPSQTVTILGGQNTTLGLTVPFQVLGTAAGTIHVTGVPARLPITGYTVTACPTSTAPGSFLSCVNEFSGPGGFGFFGGAAAKRVNGASAPLAGQAGAARTPFNLYQLPTLTPGSWTLRPGYQTVFGSFTDPVGTTVTIVAGQTTTQKLTLPYQTPSTGVVTGKVVVIGAPTNGFQSGVRACSSLPSGTSCSNEQDAFNQSGGLYKLSLAPGTWWVSGFVDVFGFISLNETTTAPIVVTVTAGSHTIENYTVKVAVP
jgi:hypothetical protein